MNINELSREQKYAFNKFIKGENMFITGPGGTGKSRLIKHFVHYSKSIGKNIDICAMTGCAAVLLECNAKTLHSWSGIKIANGDKHAIISKVMKNKIAVHNWKKTKVLVLDEVSMLSKKIFEIIEEIGRRIKRSSAPFGGIQVIFTGDFFQLPPIGTDGEPDTEMFCFESSLWASVFKAENIIQLTTMFRQTDPLYIEILSQIRKGYIDEDNKRVLKSYVNREYDATKNNGCALTKLFALRSKTDYVNNMMFSKLNEKEYVFELSRSKSCKTYLDNSKPIDTQTLQVCSQYSSTDLDFELDAMTNNMPSPQVLRLKKGAAVMCTVNLDQEQGICNGSQGVVIDFRISNNAIGGGGDTLALPVVRFSNGVIKVMDQYFWQSENIPTVSIGQVPLCLAWAITIHKMQGATLDMAEMDIGYTIFEFGQSYVALSRIKTLDGLYLSAFHADKIKANPKVVTFYNSIPILDLPVGFDETLDFEQYKYGGDGGGCGGCGGGDGDSGNSKDTILKRYVDVKVIKL